MSGRSQTHRRAIALVTCVLWLLAVELLPNLHLAEHADDHTHASDGRIVRVTRVVLDDDAHDDAHAHAHAHGRVHAHRTHADAHHSELALVERAAPPAPELAAEEAAEPAHEHPRRARRAQLALDDDGPGHAAAGVAHHQLALHRPPPPLVAPIALERVAWPLAFALDDRRADLALARPAARGPPLA